MFCYFENMFTFALAIEMMFHSGEQIIEKFKMVW